MATNNWKNGVTEIVYQEMGNAEILLFQSQTLPETLKKVTFGSLSTDFPLLLDLIAKHPNLKMSFSDYGSTPSSSPMNLDSPTEKLAGTKRSAAVWRPLIQGSSTQQIERSLWRPITPSSENSENGQLEHSNSLPSIITVRKLES